MTNTNTNTKNTKRMRNSKLTRYSDQLLIAKNILNISTFMHENVHDLEKYFSTEDMATKNRPEMTNEEKVKFQNNFGPRQIVESEEDIVIIPDNGYMDKVYHYLTGEKIESKVQDKETGTETTTVEDVRTRVAIFRTPQDARYKRDSQYTLVGGSFSNVVFAPVNDGEYTYYQFGRHEPVKKKMKLKDFDAYSTVQNLNFECWLFRSMSPDVELVMAYLEKYHCPGIDIDPNDIPMLLERFGLEPATVQDIEELK